MNLEQIITLQEARMSVYGSSNQDMINNTTFDNFNENPAYREIEFNGEMIGVHIIDNQINTRDGTINRYMIAEPPMEFKIGDMIVDDKGDYWICILINNLQYNKVLIIPCNNILTFQTPDTTIHTIPCILTDRASVYSDGVDDTKYLSLPDGLIKIVVPNNTTTNTFDLLNKKLIFDHSIDSVYKVKKVGKLLKQGLIEIIAEIQVCDPNTDNLELNLSNYIDTTKPEIPEIPPEIPDERNYEVILYGQDTITLMQTGNYSVRTFDNGIETSHEVKFEIDNTSLANIKSQDGRNCVVATNTNFSMGEVKLKVILLVDEAVFVEKTIGITGF